MKTKRAAILAAMSVLAYPIAHGADVTMDQTNGTTMSQSPVVVASTDTRNDMPVRIVKRGVAPEVVDVNTLPVKVDADKMSYNDTTGAMWATGTVDVVQGNREIHAPRIDGNTKTGEYVASGGYHYMEDKGALKDLKGDTITYNTISTESSTKKPFGYVDPYWVKAEQADFNGQTGLIKKGWVTSKHAIAFKGVPDYRVEGDEIEVIPNDKAIIHNAKFFIKNAKILSLSKYTVSLKRDKKGEISIFSLLPRPYYNSSDGVGLKGNIEYPVSDTGTAYFRYTLATSIGFKPTIGYREQLPWGYANIAYSRESSSLNARTVWIEKRPELSVYTNTYHIGSSPITIRGGASIGQWHEDYLNGQHRMWNVETSHDPVKIGKTSDARIFAGYQQDHYSYNDHTRNMPYWGIHTNHQLNDNVNLWIGYRQANIDPINDSPYPFDTIDVRHNLYYGASVKVSRLDRVGLSVQKDMQSKETRYVDITWYRDMHSFDGSLTYRTKQHKWEYVFKAKDF